uniref:Uncharacterized protein n=1 Tax=viral metagenome TaxID=1070528 RepID=A0A6C0BMP9_9ZZZZ
MVILRPILTVIAISTINTFCVIPYIIDDKKLLQHRVQIDEINRSIAKLQGKN